MTIGTVVMAFIANMKKSGSIEKCTEEPGFDLIMKLLMVHIQ